MEPRPQHYWDAGEALGAAYRDLLELEIEAPAWDIYLLYDAGVQWPGSGVPAPRYWEHQLDGVTNGPHLDANVFRKQVLEALSEAGRAG